jgi:predicted nucleotidyltransferase
MTSKIDRLFGSKTRVKILCELLLNLDRTYYLRELSRKLKIPYSVLYKEVKNLVNIDIVRREKRGKITLLTVNKRLPYFNELKILLIKTAALGDALGKILGRFPGIRYALIYGSFASGRVDEKSDVDLLIVGSVNEERIIDEMSKVEEKLGREINYILWSKEAFLSRVKKKHHLLAEIAEGPIVMLTGDEDEFRGVIKR